MTGDRSRQVERMRQHLAEVYGDLGWWPGKTPEEIAIGAVLTQHTAWSNVEKAIANLRDRDWLRFPALLSAGRDELAEAIRPSGYFNQKAKKLQALAQWVCDRGDGSLQAALAGSDTNELRRQLLKVWGIGRETADAILLYAANRRIFVVDAYTMRIFARHALCTAGADYDEVRGLVERSIPPEVPLYNAFHAHLVQVGKEVCHRRQPMCDRCPLQGM